MTSRHLALVMLVVVGGFRLDLAVGQTQASQPETIGCEPCHHDGRRLKLLPRDVRKLFEQGRSMRPSEMFPGLPLPDTAPPWPPR